MKRVTGIGGVFFQCQDPAKMREWYQEHLGIVSGEEGASFHWRHADDPERSGQTVWALFKAGTGYFRPSEKPFMFNYRVENLRELFAALKAEGVSVVGEIEETPYGRFGWIMDPEGNKIELWEPPAEPEAGGAS